MPLFDGVCDHCGWADEIVIPLSEHKPAGFTCPHCSQQARRVLSPVTTIGPMPSKPLVVNQIGRTFESKAEVDKYLKENPKAQIHSAESAEWRAHKDWAREKSEKSAKKAGFRDREDRIQHGRREDAHRARLAAGEKSITTAGK